MDWSQKSFDEIKPHRRVSEIGRRALRSLIPSPRLRLSEWIESTINGVASSRSLSILSWTLPFLDFLIMDMLCVLTEIAHIEPLPARRAFHVVVGLCPSDAVDVPTRFRHLQRL